MSADISPAARLWLKTRFKHQGHLRGVYADCVGLVGGVAIDCRRLPANFWTTAALPFLGYDRTPADGQLERVCDVFMPRIHPDDAGVGDVFGIAFKAGVQHLSIIVDRPDGLGLSLIHALLTSRMVVEHLLDDDWRAKVRTAWRMPEVVA